MRLSSHLPDHTCVFTPIARPFAHWLVIETQAEDETHSYHCTAIHQIAPSFGHSIDSVSNLTCLNVILTRECFVNRRMLFKWKNVRGKSLLSHGRSTVDAKETMSLTCRQTPWLSWLLLAAYAISLSLAAPQSPPSLQSRQAGQSDQPNNATLIDASSSASSDDLDSRATSYTVSHYQMRFSHPHDQMLQQWSHSALQSFSINLDSRYLYPIINPIPPSAAATTPWPNRRFFYQQPNPRIYINVTPARRGWPSWQREWEFSVAEMEAMAQGVREWVRGLNEYGEGLPIVIEVVDLNQGKNTVVAQGKIDGLLRDGHEIEMGESGTVNNGTVEEVAVA